MTKLYMLDASPLGKIAHAKAKPEISEWFKRIMASGARIIIPEIADYEVRRSLILEGLKKSIIKLDNLKETVEYLPITTEVMLKAANLWAEARKKGNPTADPKGARRKAA